MFGREEFQRYFPAGTGITNPFPKKKKYSQSRHNFSKTYTKVAQIIGPYNYSVLTEQLDVSPSNENVAVQEIR